MVFEGFECVGRAGGSEPARRGTTVDGALVPDHEAGEARRASLDTWRWTAETSSIASRVSWANDRSTTSGRAPTRYQPGGSGVDDSGAARFDNTARRRRRTRLRTTDEPMARPIAKATRGGDAEGSGRKVHQSTPARARRPSRVRRAKTSRSRMRQIKPRACGDPWHGATSARRDRRGCSCVRESRACGLDDGCSVGRCASRHPPRRDSAGAAKCWDKIVATRLRQLPLTGHEPPQVRAAPPRRQHGPVRAAGLERVHGGPASVLVSLTHPSTCGFVCPHRVDNDVDT